MNDPMESPSSAPQPAASASSTARRNYLIAVVALLAVFGVPLYQLLRFALGSELYSHLWLVPLSSLYLVWLDRARLPRAEFSSRPGALVLGLLAGGAGLAGWYLLAGRVTAALAPQNAHALAVYAFLLLFAGLTGLLLGRKVLRAVAVPLVYGIFMAPFPLAVEAMLENFLQYGSSLAAHGMFQLSGMPFLREGTFFLLPGFSMEVAPECSGIHSTLALFLTSLYGGRLLLHSPWRQAILALVVLPIALLRNGLRVFTIGQLCVRIGPEMIESWVHKQGGPFFFVLSLVPFSLILLYLIKTDRAARRATLPKSPR